MLITSRSKQYILYTKLLLQSCQESIIGDWLCDAIIWYKIDLNLMLFCSRAIVRNVPAGKLA